MERRLRRGDAHTHIAAARVQGERVIRNPCARRIAMECLDSRIGRRGIARGCLDNLGVLRAHIRCREVQVACGRGGQRGDCDGVRERIGA